MRLNREQLQAVKHTGGPLLIIAGAGTGKTTVITERIKHIILNGDAKPSEILALTFTEKAAREMEERVDLAMPFGYTSMWISTFHSFCDQILRQEAFHIGLDPDFKLMAEAESVQFIRNWLFEFDFDYFAPLGNPTKFIGAIVQHFSRLKDEAVSVEEYLAYAKKLAKRKPTEESRLEHQKTNELAKAYTIYEKLKVKGALMDFGDLIVKTLSLFRKRANVLKKYRDQFKYILVDEFQDTNIAQYELVKLLAPPPSGNNLTVTGDDSQSIYKFRGAAVSNILQFKDDYRKVKTVVLIKNYRSTQPILDSAYRLIRNNNPDTLEVKLKIDKNLVSVKKERLQAVSYLHADRVENEAEAVARKIEAVVEKQGFDFKDIAILVRANNHAEAFTRALGRHGIPSQFLGPGRLFKQDEVVDLISYLKVLNNFEDSVALYRLLSIPHLKINAKDLAAIGNFSKKLNLSLFEACERVNEIFVSGKTKEKVEKIAGLAKKHLRLLRKQSAGQLLYFFLEATGLLPRLLSPETPEAEKKAANIAKFFDRLKTYEVDHEDASVRAVTDWLELSMELGESPLAADIDWTKVNAVNVLTVHSSKGLEFPVCFLVNLVAQRFPTLERKEKIPIPEVFIKELLPQGDHHLQEERRLFYVGMTRAKELLFLTAADYYGEGKRQKKLSPFVTEALGKDFSSEILTKGGQLSFLDFQEKERRKDRPVDFKVDFLSYSQIQTFDVCPLHYKLKYILKVPTPPSASQSFGVSIHRTLKAFYQRVKEGVRPSEKLLFALLFENWQKEGFTTKSHEKKFMEKGRLYLSGFLKEVFDPKILPVSLEESFVIPLWSLESGSQVRPLKIGGQIDRVDFLPGGGLEIIDYKTGATIPPLKEIQNDLQLSFYALAATRIPEKPFGLSADKVKLSLYFLDNQEKISTTRSKEDLEKAIRQIFKKRDEIEKSDFRCSGHILCQNCEYKLLCQGG